MKALCLAAALTAAVAAVGVAGTSPELQWSSDAISVVHVTHDRDLPRANMTLFSVLKHVQPGIIAEYLLVIPPGSMQHDVCRLQPAAFPVRCIADTRVVGMTRRELTRRVMDQHWRAGYNFQMALKLWVSQRVRTRYYLTLDSDIIMQRPLEHLQWLLPYGKAFYVAMERKVHDNWFTASEQLLQSPPCLSTAPTTPTFGVTPAVLHTSTARLATRMLEALYTPSEHLWDMLLNKTIDSLYWTEYSVYRIVGCLRGDFDTYHTSVTELQGSPKLYDGLWKEEHLAKGCKEGTLFCVVQSTIRSLSPDDVARMFPRVFSGGGGGTA